ncbi:MAG TPA: twin-arginine translocase subunit TatC [bacterium]|nr:twin-arginine translocase subunit TatC [bacterium]
MRLRSGWSALWLAKSLPRRETDFLSHLEELRHRLIVSIAAFFIASVISYFFSQALLDLLIEPLHRYEKIQLFFQKPYEAFLTHLKVAAFAGFVLSSPVFFTQLWLFISPGLYEKEKRVLLPLILVSIALFLIGTSFAYLVVIPWGLHFLLGFQTESLKPLLTVGTYFSFLLGMMLAFGALFDFPVVMIGLVQLKLVTTKTLAKSRKLTIVLIFIAAALLTPSPDPASQLALALPLLLLFEISLLAAGWLERRAKH